MVVTETSKRKGIPMKCIRNADGLVKRRADNEAKRKDDIKKRKQEKQQSKEKKRGYNKLSTTDTSEKPPAYQLIKKNIYVERPQIVEREADSNVCNCVYIEGFSACDTDNCENRATKVECHPKTCPCGIYCQNQRLSKQQGKKIEIYKTEKKGWGIRSTSDIQPHQFVAEYVGEVITLETCMSRLEEAKKEGITNFYMLTLSADEVIDASRKGAKTRFINHSCNPNCETQKWFVRGELRVGIFSIKYIPRGEEITFDYQFERIGGKKQECFCGEPNCRGWLGAKPNPSSKALLASTSNPTLGLQSSAATTVSQKSVEPPLTPHAIAKRTLRSIKKINSSDAHNYVKIKNARGDELRNIKENKIFLLRNSRKGKLTIGKRFCEMRYAKPTRARRSTSSQTNAQQKCNILYKK